jgi:hypothetical protein
MTGRKVWPLTLTKVTSVMVTKKKQVSMTREMMKVTVEIKSYIGRDSGLDKKQAWLGKWWRWQLRWKVTLGMNLDMIGIKVWPLELVNVLSAIVVIKNYHKRDSGDYGKQGVTPQINRCAECDINDEKRPKA